MKLISLEPLSCSEGVAESEASRVVSCKPLTQHFGKYMNIALTSDLLDFQQRANNWMDSPFLPACLPACSYTHLLYNYRRGSRTLVFKFHCDIGISYYFNLYSSSCPSNKKQLIFKLINSSNLSLWVLPQGLSMLVLFCWSSIPQPSVALPLTQKSIPVSSLGV